MSKALRDRITQIEADIEALTEDAINSGDEECLKSLFTVCDDNATRIKTERQAAPIRKRFDTTVRRVDVEEYGQRFLDLCNVTKCTGKDFDRLDYHIESAAHWTITLPEDNEEVQFECSYNGDNEGEGTYDWSILGSRGECSMPDDLQLNPKNKKDVATATKLGLELDAASYFLNIMFSSSFS